MSSMVHAELVALAEQMLCDEAHRVSELEARRTLRRLAKRCTSSAILADDEFAYDGKATTTPFALIG